MDLKSIFMPTSAQVMLFSNSGASAVNVHESNDKQAITCSSWAYLGDMDKQAYWGGKEACTDNPVAPATYCFFPRNTIWCKGKLSQLRIQLFLA